ncbi:MAG TPA: choice-of-anchor tandem repeat GloVer-containing protein [Stellaceae bacterium]|nr:choice-of-anchor tandem repeat GloVer-containing protein [Stellaceae bacterium]
MIYSFQGGSDGYEPSAGLVSYAGNFYGTTAFGGAPGNGCVGGTVGCGTVFKLTSIGTESVLYSFAGAETGGTDGAEPFAPLIVKNGNLYGTTERGGTASEGGSGTLFELTPTGTETVLYSFCSLASCTDGAQPDAGIVFKGTTFYGTTRGGGTGFSGTVFKLVPPAVSGPWTESVVYPFTGGTGTGDGQNVYAGLLARGPNFVGTTTNGGAAGVGTVYMVTPRGVETVLYSFTGGADGGYPVDGLIADKAGNLYGTTGAGGATAPSGCGGAGCGAVFELSPPASPGGAWTETVIYSFLGGTNGNDPAAGLLAKKAPLTGAVEALYGTTYEGGDLACNSGYDAGLGCGTVYELTPPASPGGAWTETVLHAFAGSPDGAVPSAPLIFKGSAHLLGTTIFGGTGAAPNCGQFGGISGCGTVFEVTTP